MRINGGVDMALIKCSECGKDISDKAKVSLISYAIHVKKSTTYKC